MNTGPDGRFSIKEEGFILSLESIAKEGYEYLFHYCPERIFSFRKDEEKAELGQLKETPILFKLRKKGTPTLILTAGASFSLHPGDSHIFDLLWQQARDSNRILALGDTYRGWHADLRIGAEAGEDGVLNLVLQPLDDDTGVLLDERTLYEAPEGGYQPVAYLPIREGSGLETFAYIRGRGGKFYTRMKIEAGHRQEKIFVHVSYATNPEGGRNLEFGTEEAKRYQQELNARTRRPYGYDPNAKGLSIEERRQLHEKYKQTARPGKVKHDE
ncbi:MAG: hypothetical protein IH614_19725 [Desulfuromonadales bacterium]|nr:hypothetical protein [Desulfuromonadales bacterium]